MIVAARSKQYNLGISYKALAHFDSSGNGSGGGKCLSIGQRQLVALQQAVGDSIGDAEYNTSCGAVANMSTKDNICLSGSVAIA